MSIAGPTHPRAVRVICVVYHPGPELEDFAASLGQATTAPLELVLVDNGTDDSESRRVAQAHRARVVTPG